LRRAKPRVASLRSPLTAFLAALALFVQLVDVSYHQARAAALGRSDAAIAAELRATFGDAAALCVQSDDKGAPHTPNGCCGDQCTFCRFAAHAAALVAPEASALPIRLDVACRGLGPTPEPGFVSERPAQQNRARAPPLAV
jgi:hypothetical protein